MGQISANLASKFKQEYAETVLYMIYEHFFNANKCRFIAYLSLDIGREILKKFKISFNQNKILERCFVLNDTDLKNTFVLCFLELMNNCWLRKEWHMVHI